MTTPEIPAFEPDVSLMCDDSFGPFRCTRACDHDGDHVAHGWDFPRVDRVRVIRSWPQLRLSDVLNADGFPPGPPSLLRDAVIDDAMNLIMEDAGAEALKRQAQAQTRAAKEIQAAWHDPNWLDGRF